MKSFLSAGKSATAITTRRSSECECVYLWDTLHCFSSCAAYIKQAEGERERESERETEICLKEKSLKQRVAAGNCKGVTECVCVSVFVLRYHQTRCKLYPCNNNKNNNNNSSKVKLNWARIIFMTVVSCSRSCCCCYCCWVCYTLTVGICMSRSCLPGKGDNTIYVHIYVYMISVKKQE